MRIKILFFLIMTTSSLSAKFYHWSSLPNTCYDVSTSSCPSGYSPSGSKCKKNVSYDFYEYKCSDGYTPINYGFTSYTKTDPNTNTKNEHTLDDDVNSATPPIGNCKKTITYSYYNYNCPSGYTVDDGGLYSACEKTDPDKTSDNSSTLSQACNSATPPTGNCTREIPYTYYSYECSAGYTAVDNGLNTCVRTDNDSSSDTSNSLSQDCNSATPPSENCYKDISYKHYTYGCSPGYFTDNYGLSTCEKTDPDRSSNNSELLDDACNSKEPPEGNCQKPFTYNYYEYICNGENIFREEYNVLNPGLDSCVREDDDLINTNPELEEQCNSPIPPDNNCRATEYTCNSTHKSPAFVDGSWQCSLFACNDSRRCGYATCNGLPTSSTSIMPQSFLPIERVVSSGSVCEPRTCSKQYEYNDGSATKINKKVCEGTIQGEKCIKNSEDIGFKEYYYYEYTCPSGSNSFGKSWELKVSNVDPGCVDDTFGGCINFERQTSVCQREIYTCPSGDSACTLGNNGVYQCTLNNCDDTRQPCFAQVCGLALNSEISYCEESNCPTAEGVFEEDGKCFIEDCPQDTLIIDGKCYRE